MAIWPQLGSLYVQWGNLVELSIVHLPVLSAANFHFRDGPRVHSKTLAFGGLLRLPFLWQRDEWNAAHRVSILLGFDLLPCLSRHPISPDYLVCGVRTVEVDSVCGVRERMKKSCTLLMGYTTLLLLLALLLGKLGEALATSGVQKTCINGTLWDGVMSVENATVWQRAMNATGLGLVLESPESRGDAVFVRGRVSSGGAPVAASA
eukprot:jgi/Picsp_1/1661/NSC_05135-R1_---NA---